MNSMKRFDSKIVLVTGAGHGIGRAVAERFAAEGAHVIVNDISEPRAHETAQAIGGHAIVADVSVKSQVNAMFDTVIGRFGTLDVLVNNAADINVVRHFLDADEAWW